MQDKGIMSGSLAASKESIVILLKGGLLQSWSRLSEERQKDYNREHVQLMLSVAETHRMMRLEGYKLIAPEQPWLRFWVIEFPTLEGAEAWIDAEMAPPFGPFRYCEYWLARKWAPDHLRALATLPSRPLRPMPVPDPRNIPPLAADKGSFVVLNFARQLPESTMAEPETTLEAGYLELIEELARTHALMRLECFKLIAPQSDCRYVWVAELPTLEAAEVWIEAHLRPPIDTYTNNKLYVAHKWAPDYCASWIPRN